MDCVAPLISSADKGSIRTAASPATSGSELTLLVITGAPAAMALVELITFVICLAITSGAFLTTYNAGFAVNIIFSLAVGGCNAYMLLNKDVSKALK